MRPWKFTLLYPNLDAYSPYCLKTFAAVYAVPPFKSNADNIGFFQGQMKVPNVYDNDLRVIYNNILNNSPASFALDFSDKGLKNTVISFWVSSRFEIHIYP